MHSTHTRDNRLVQTVLPSYSDLAEAMNELLNRGDEATRDYCADLLNELPTYPPAAPNVSTSASARRLANGWIRGTLCGPSLARGGLAFRFTSLRGVH